MCAIKIIFLVLYYAIKGKCDCDCILANLENTLIDSEYICKKKRDNS